MHLLNRLGARLEQVRRHRPAPPEPRGVRHELDRSGRGSPPELARAALEPDEATRLVARAVSLRAF